MKATYLFFCLLMLPILSSGQEPGKDAVVSATRMNVLYRGLANPVEISVPGVTSDKISATMTNGTMKKGTNGWDVSPGDQNETVITVLVNNKKVSEKTFRVKNVPVPVAVFANVYNGATSKDIAKNTDVLEAKLIDFDWDLKFTIKSFTFFISKDGSDIEITSGSDRLTDKMKSLISDLKSGQNIIFKDIKAIGPDGRIRDLDPIVLKIN